MAPHTIPDNLTDESFVDYIIAVNAYEGKDLYCPDKVRMFLLESEGYTGAYSGEIVPLKKKLQLILDFGFCYTDAKFRTGWIERDGTCRSNDYGCHDMHVYALNRTPSEVERMGWIHVSTHECTAYFNPTLAQKREIRRIGKRFNEDTVFKRWIPVNPSQPVSEQLSVLYA